MFNQSIMDKDDEKQIQSEEQESKKVTIQMMI